MGLLGPRPICRLEVNEVPPRGYGEPRAPLEGRSGVWASVPQVTASPGLLKGQAA